MRNFINKMNKKTIIRILVVILFLYGLYKVGRVFGGAGSYPYAEAHELDYPEEQVIQAAEIVKKENIYLTVGKGGRWEDRDTTDYWHHIYFNFHNRILLTWTRPNNNNGTTFAFVRIQDENSNWKDINEDFGYFENKKLINQLDKEILQKMKLELIKGSKPK